MAWAALESIGWADEPPAACRRFGAAAPAPASAASTPARARLAVVAVAGVAPACVCGASAALYTQEPSAALVGSASTLAAAAGLAYVRKASARRATTVSGSCIALARLPCVPRALHHAAALARTSPLHPRRRCASCAACQPCAKQRGASHTAYEGALHGPKRRGVCTHGASSTSFADARLYSCRRCDWMNATSSSSTSTSAAASSGSAGSGITARAAPFPGGPPFWRPIAQTKAYAFSKACDCGCRTGEGRPRVAVTVPA